MPSRSTRTAKTTADETPQGEQPTPPEEDVDLEEYEQRRLELIARLKEEVSANGMPKTVYGKLAMITGLVGQIRKSGVNTFHNYRYAKESDLVEAIRPMLSALRIFVWWSLADGGAEHPEIIPHERLIQTLTAGRQDQKHVIGEAATLTKVMAWFWFIDDEGNKTEPQLMAGYGDDNSDKGLYKALTGMEKYFLFKTFLVSTGDDPEGDPRADQRAAGRNQPPQVQQSQRPQGSTQHGGRQQAVSKPQNKVLGDLLRAKGIKGSPAALAYLGEKLGTTFEVSNGDAAATLAEVINNIPPKRMGELIAGMRAEVEGTAGAGETETPAEEGPAAASAPTAGSDEAAASPAEGEAETDADDAGSID